ncbi:MAG TPA: hypothetical protein VKZ42_06040 [Flavobacteriaceae bacterium]|nr:hypothetical protein [Flavobacteriaceae bacterium]
MEQTNINVGKVILKALELIIIKPLTLPYKIYKNALVALSNSDSEDSEETNLSGEFPLYVWLVSIFSALIVAVYPLGALFAIFTAITTKSFMGLITALIMVYFAPLALGLYKELLLITLKSLNYLKIISKK